VRQSVEDTFKTAVDAKVWDCLFGCGKIAKLVEEAINLRMDEIIEKQISNRIREIVNKETRWDSEITKRIIENTKDIIQDLEIITSERLQQLEDIEEKHEQN
jgi:ribonucleotide reductase beta subunit family protein with ferritin-like domain